MALGNELTHDLLEFEREIRKCFYFMKAGFENIQKVAQGTDDYLEELKPDIEFLKNNLQEIKNQDSMGKRLRESVFKIDSLARMYEFEDTQKETAYRMAHIFFISVYEGFLKEIFKKIYSSYPNLMVSNKYSFSKIKSMNPDELNKLILIKTTKIANVEELEKVLINNNIKIDSNTQFKEWNNLKESYFRRHIIVHKHGIYDEKYINDTGSSNTLIGTEIKTDYDYITQLAKNICAFMSFLISQLLANFNLSIKTQSIVKDAEDALEKLKKHSK